MKSMFRIKNLYLLIATIALVKLLFLGINLIILWKLGYIRI
ncbi:MAG: hypothetical protein ABH851_08835 [Methanobacteriota archaeon]